MSSKSDWIEEHVAGMFLIGESENEVRLWMSREKGIYGEAADHYVRLGKARLRKEVRQQAMMRLVFSAVGFSLFVGYLLIQYSGGFVLVGLPVLVVWGVGLLSLTVLLCSIAELMTGSTKRPLQ